MNKFVALLLSALLLAPSLCACSNNTVSRVETKAPSSDISTYSSEKDTKMTDSSAAPHTSSADTVPPDIPGPGTLTSEVGVPETEPPEYIALPSPIMSDVDLFSAHEGIARELAALKPELEYNYYPLPEGVIYGASYSGYEEDGTLYIDPAGGLTLYVSLGISDKNYAPGETKTVYLTFDDGPSAKNSNAILDVLKEYGVKATCCTVGRYVSLYPELVKRMKDEGHMVGCHSYTHNYDIFYGSDENFLDELARWEEAVTSALGYLPPEHLFRFPGGSNFKGSDFFKKLLRVRGYSGFDWNALSNDCLIKTRPEGMSEEDYIKESFISTVAYSFRLKNSPHIVLMHETYSQTPELLGWMIEYLYDMGCTFDTLDKISMQGMNWYY